MNGSASADTGNWTGAMPETTIDYASANAPLRRNSVFQMLPAAMGMSFVFAVTYVVVMTLTLPPSDGAYGQAPFADPLVFPIMCIGAAVAGVVVCPFYYFALRTRPFFKSLAIVMGVVLAEIMVVTPFDSGLGFLGSFLAFFVGLGIARAMQKPRCI